MDKIIREYSHQFPRQQDKLPVEQLTINKRANILFESMIENCDTLIEYIMFPERRELLNKKYYDKH